MLQVTHLSQKQAKGRAWGKFVEKNSDLDIRNCALENNQLVNSDERN